MSRYTASSATSICNVLYSFYNHHVHMDRIVREEAHTQNAKTLARAYARMIAGGTRNGEREREGGRKRKRDRNE